MTISDQSEVDIENGKSFVGGSCLSIEVIGDDYGDKGFLIGEKIVESFEKGTNGDQVKAVNEEEEANIENESTVNHTVTMKMINGVSQEAVNIHVDVSDDDDIGKVSAKTINKEVTNFDSESSQPPENSKDMNMEIELDGLIVVDIFGGLQESGMEEGEPLLSDIVGEDANGVQNIFSSDDEAAQSTNEVEQPLQVNDDDDKESQMVVMENVEAIAIPDPDDDATQSANEAEAEQPLDIIDDNKESQMLVIENVEDTANLNNHATQSADEVEKTMDDNKESIVVVSESIEHTASLDDDVAQSVTITDETIISLLVNDFLEFLKRNESADKVVEDMDDVVPISPIEVSSLFIDAQIEDTDTKIHEVEDMIQHETLCLKDENQFIRMSYRDKLASNIGSKEHEIEEPLKEPNSLKDNVSEPEHEVAPVLEIRKTYEENEKGKEQQTPFQAAIETKTICETVEQGKKTDSSAKKEDTDYQTMRKVVRKSNHTIRNKEPAKFMVRESIFSCLNEIPEDEEKEETVLEFDKKSDILRKEEPEKKKKTNEKMREKRLRRKERKKTGGDNGNFAKENESLEMNSKPHLSQQLNPKIIFALVLILIFSIFTIYLN